METAKIVTNLMSVLALSFIFLRLVQLYSPYPPSRCHQSFDQSMCEGRIHQGYTRFADVERRCQSVLSSAAELEADADRDGNNLMYQLSFMDGDWSQDAGEAPLLPFHGSYADLAGVAGPELLEAVPLVSFSLKHIDMAAQRPGPRTALNASGILSFAIARNSSCSYDPHFKLMEPCPLPEFDLRPGIAKLQILLQGVYTEMRLPGSGGERVLCMVGDAVLPVRGSNSTEQWDWAKDDGHGNSNNLEPPVVSDGNILLVLRYPKTPTLTTRAVHGVMTSTNAKSDSAYFDTVRLVSQLSGRGYQFQKQDMEHDAAASGDDEHPSSFHEGAAMEHHYSLNSGTSPCDIVYQSIPNMMEVVPNWDCKGTDDFCSRLGPFVSSSSRSRPATATSSTEEDTAFTRSAIAVTGLLCESLGGSIGGTAAARVAAVFRYVPPWEHHPMAAKRTGLSSTTLSAEGVWIPSTGRAHMVACLGVGKEACHYRVTLSLQTTVSMTRRAIVAGQITAMDGRSHPPLLFQQRLCGRFAPYVTSRRRMSYIYTKVDQAVDLLRASKPTGFRDSFVAKSLLSYPSVDDSGAANGDIANIGSLSNLADELDLRYQCMEIKLPPIVPEWIDRSSSFFELQILSAGTLVGRSYSPQLRRRPRMRIVELLKRVHGEKRQQILNLSAELMAYGNCHGPSPVMSLEGVYNAEDGRMYMLGCRTVHAPRRRLLSMSKDLEDGMDCSIEVIVEYPPTTTRWLISRPAKVSIASTRDDDDPLHFNRTELDMLPVKNRQTRSLDLELHELAKLVVKGFLYFIALLATIWTATRTSP